MTGVMDDRGNGTVIVTVEADDRQRLVDHAAPVEPDRCRAVGFRHAPVHRQRRAAPPRPHADGAHRGGGVCSGTPDRVENRLDIGHNEVTVPADPCSPELDRHRDGVVVRRPHGDELRRQIRGLRDHRPGTRRLSVVENAEVDVRDRSPGAVGSLDDEHRRPELEIVALGDLVHLVPPTTGRNPDRRGDVGPPDSGAHAHAATTANAPCIDVEGRLTAAAGRSSAGQRTPWAAPRPTAEPRRASGREGARRPFDPSRSCRGGRRPRPAGRDR